MKTFYASTLMFALVLANLGAAASDPSPLGPTATVVIPAGILIPTHLAEPMDSGEVHTGDLFEFVVGRDVVVDKYVVIPLGSRGVGHVTDAHAAGSHGKSGGIRLAFDYVFAADGSQIPVAHNKQASQADNGGGVAAATALGILTFGIGGLFAHNFIHGKNVVIPETAITNVETLANKSVTLNAVKYLAPEPAATPSSPADGSANAPPFRKRRKGYEYS